MTGPSEDERERTRTVSDNASETEDRDRTSDDRDKTAEAHDRSAASRDQRSERRDQRAEARDEREGRVDVDAASDRAGARRDRRGAAGDRKHAEHDRDAAQIDRDLSAAHRAALLLDRLTGAYRREAGFLELEREVVQAKRTEESFVLAFIDLDDLKATNDSLGHAAGDQRLAKVAQSLREVLREYDVVVRYGGDEFLCGLAGVGMADAAMRLERLNADLTKGNQGSITVGLAELEPGEGLFDLISRADAAMYARRGRGSAKG